MRTIIVGGGLAGVTTLYMLAARGENALLLEATGDVAMGASHANGGMITPSMADPWNAPGVQRHLVSSLFSPGSALKLRVEQIPRLARWGLAFLHAATTARHVASTRANFLLAARSAQATWALAAELGIAFAANELGTLKVFETAAAMAGPLTMARHLAPLGLNFNAVDARGAVMLEPCLAPVADRIHGALFYPDDRVGDARLFTQRLAAIARQNGATLQTNASVERITRHRGGGFTVATAKGALQAGRVVVAAGTATPRLLRQFGVWLPIAPAKGYSLTFDLPRTAAQPRIAVVDDAMHAAVVPIGERLRVVGTAEFAGFDRAINPGRVANLAALLAKLYPTIATDLDLDQGLAWAGLRPMSADGRPFIGESRVPGLWVNSGHGHLGWTKAVGSAQLLIQLMLGDRPGFDPAPFALVGRRLID